MLNFWKRSRGIKQIRKLIEQTAADNDYDLLFWEDDNGSKTLTFQPYTNEEGASESIINSFAKLLLRAADCENLSHRMDVEVVTTSSVEYSEEDRERGIPNIIYKIRLKVLY